MCNPILCFLINDVSWSKIFEDIFSGSVLIWIGLIVFKWQKGYEASAQEVRGLCKKIDEFLKPFFDLNFQIKSFEFNIRVGFQAKRSNFLEKFFSKSQIENQVGLTILRSKLSGDVNVAVPDDLARVLSLQEPLSLLIHLGARLCAAQRVLVETMERFNAGNSTVIEENVKNIWDEYQKAREAFFKHLSALESIVHNAIHGSYNWDQFNEEVKKKLDKGDE